MIEWERVYVLNKIRLIVDFVQNKIVMGNSTVKWKVV